VPLAARRTPKVDAISVGVDRMQRTAFKELDPIPQFKATAKLGPYLERVSGF
jgi:hypothetical protein